MKMTFSQRQGVEAAPQVLRLSEMPMTLRNALWNVFDVHLWQSNDFVYFRATGQPGYVVQVSALLWDEFFHWPLDQRRMHRGSLDADGIRNVVRRYFFEAPWNKVYEFFEFLLGYRFSHDLLARRLGEVLEREMAPCRIINAEFVEITNELEIEMLNTAIEGGQFAAPAEHLKTALRNL